MAPYSCVNDSSCTYDYDTFAKFIFIENIVLRRVRETHFTKNYHQETGVTEAVTGHINHGKDINNWKDTDG